MAKIFHYHAHAHSFDAVTNHMLSLQKWMAEVGVQGEVLAHHIRGVEGKVKPFGSVKLADDDFLFIHHSQGNPELPKVLASNGRKALVYHNITPPKFFTHDGLGAKMAKLGRDQLSLFKGVAKIIFADSQFNAFEIEEWGLGPVKLLPLLDLHSLPSPVFSRRSRSTTKRLLFVGRLSPHKAQAELVKVLYYLRKESALDFRLTLVGSQDPLYGRYVKSLAKALGLAGHVHFFEKIEDAALQKIYSESDAFVSLSRHEGFGIPLTEAIRFGVPVFALWRAAVNETMGGAGVGFLTTKPHRVAEIVRQSLLDPEILEAILKGQQEQWKRLCRLQSKKVAQKALCRLLKINAESPPETTAWNEAT